MATKVNIGPPEAEMDRLKRRVGKVPKRELSGRERQRIAVMFSWGKKSDSEIGAVFGLHPATVRKMRGEFHGTGKGTR